MNGVAVTDTRADGDYTFTITGGEGATPTTKTVVITVTNGVAASATIDGQPATLGTDGYVTVADLPVGAYTVTETPVNGMNIRL